MQRSYVFPLIRQNINNSIQSNHHILSHFIAIHRQFPNFDNTTSPSPHEEQSSSTRFFSICSFQFLNHIASVSIRMICNHIFSDLIFFIASSFVRSHFDLSSMTRQSSGESSVMLISGCGRAIR